MMSLVEMIEEDNQEGFAAFDQRKQPYIRIIANDVQFLPHHLLMKLPKSFFDVSLQFSWMIYFACLCLSLKFGLIYPGILWLSLRNLQWFQVAFGFCLDQLMVI